MSWPVWGFDPSRSSFNPREQTLTIANVAQLQMQWRARLGKSHTDAAPILVVGAGPSGQIMLFATTVEGTTLGIDAASGQVLWRFKTRGGRSTRSAPAADPSGATIYAPGVDGKMHKLTTAYGTEVTSPGSFPVTISRMPKTELNESPLNVANGYLYAALAGHYTDQTPYVGHVVAVNLSSGASTVFNALCSEKRKLLGPSECLEQRAGIWARGGAVVDPDPAMGGRVYVATGNGNFNASTGGYNYGDSVLALAADLSSLLGSYTPTDYQRLDDDNLDLSSTAPAILPMQPASKTPLMLVQGGKDAKLRLINRALLPGIGGNLQLIPLPRSLYSAPAVWTDSSGNAWIFLGFPETVRAYRLDTDASGASQLSFMWSTKAGRTLRGTSPVVANGIVFVAFNRALVALNAVTGALLWSSAMQSARGTIANVHFQSPIVVNGWVYCPDQDGYMTAYALPAPRSDQPSTRR